MASGCIANRIKNVLDKLIDKDQTVFINTKIYWGNIRLIYDILNNMVFLDYYY